MGIIEKIGYIAIFYLSYRIYHGIIRKLIDGFTNDKKIDLLSMGKWGMVTGCSHGIGKAYAEALAKAGLNVVLISPDTESLKIFADEIEALCNVRTKIIRLDFSEGMETYRAIEKEILNLEVGVLVNNLGISYPHPEYFLDLPHKDKIYMNIIHCNIVVVTNMCRIVLPQMVLRGKGIVVNISSSVALMPCPLLTVFAATKAYVLKFSRDLQIEYGKRGIIVQCLLPGTVTNHTMDSPKAGWMIPTPDEYVQSAMKTIGKEIVTTGFVPHSLLIGMVKLIYRFSPKLILIWMISVMENNRNNMLQRYLA